MAPMHANIDGIDPTRAHGVESMEQKFYVVNIEEARKISRLGRDFLRGLIRAKIIPNVGSASRIRIPLVALERYLSGEVK
jgi:Helix-turn-helix domain